MYEQDMILLFEAIKSAFALVGFVVFIIITIEKFIGGDDK